MLHKTVRYWHFKSLTQLKHTAMKSRIATYLIAICMFLTGTAFAVNPVTPPKAETSKVVANLLQQELKYPKFAKDINFECCVLVRLTIEKDGSIAVKFANSTSANMKSYVTKSIEQIDKKEFAKYAGQEFDFRINFKLI